MKNINQQYDEIFSFVRIFKRNSEFLPVDLLLEIGSYLTANNSCIMWRTTYSENGTIRVIKDYFLCRGYSDNELFIDEGDGLQLCIHNTI